MNGTVSNFTTEVWVQYFREAWPAADSSISEATIVNVREPNYYNALKAEFAATPANVGAKTLFLMNYMGWKIIEPLIPHLDDDFKAIISKFRTARTGATGSVPRWETCIDTIGTHLPNAVGSLYVRNHFRDEAKRQLETMIDYILRAFKEIIKNSYWMTETTRLRALEKADKFTQLSAYDDYLMNNPAMLNNEYASLPINDGYMTNVIAAMRYQTEVEGKFYVSGYKPTDWFSGAAIVNAWYQPPMNSITFPAGILQAPFLGDGYPSFWNFAAIGTVIGHEITHGFDDQGSTYDGDGVLSAAGWWDDASRKSFVERANGIVQQYSQYNYLGYQLNGFGNQGENIADNGGIRESYRGYKMYVEQELDNREEARLPGFEDYTTDQMFYLSYAQIWCGDYRPKEMELQLQRPHSPGKFRIIGPLQNSPEFSRAYRCGKQTYMNPAKKYGVW